LYKDNEEATSAAMHYISARDLTIKLVRKKKKKSHQHFAQSSSSHFWSLKDNEIIDINPSTNNFKSSTIKM